ncbi:MAG: agmatinase [Calditrichaeota bacterium]|jgi:agmatinase|nr:agmatinase [Calditrichota bacterium]MBT7617604.1 agmatinase [Calditrichota bacterium]MBT7790001.1 agmatinase [Calditrichota bacterium]
MKRYLAALPEGDRGEAALIGIPYDGITAYRSGAKHGPQAIRGASYSLETFSTFLDMDLLGRDYLDWGDIETSSQPGEMLKQVDERVSNALELNLKTVIFGGDRTISYGVVASMLKKFPDLAVLQVDAHACLREELDDEKLCHLTTMKRISEILPASRIYRLGIRSGTREELIEAKVELPISMDSTGIDVNSVVRAIPKDVPLYVTFDMSVFDPSLVPGVGKPKPNGFTWRDFIKTARGLNFLNVVGFDVVGLAPEHDSTGISAVIAASAVRELMLVLMK